MSKVAEENIMFQKGKLMVLHEVAMKVGDSIPKLSEGYEKAKKELEKIRYICNRATGYLEESD